VRGDGGTADDHFSHRVEPVIVDVVGKTFHLCIPEPSDVDRVVVGRFYGQFTVPVRLRVMSLRLWQSG
jgi:hypothetical protein